MKDNEIINLINTNSSATKICDNLDISYNELFSYINELKNKGIYYYPTYGNNGEIYYTLKKINSDDPIKFKAKNGMFSFIGLSDIHAGSAYDELKRLDIVNNLILTKDIHFIFNSGDNIDGPAHSNQSMPRRIYKLEQQISEFIRLYPQAYDLVTICALGDHDLGVKTVDNSTFNKILREQRHDIKVYSSGYGIIQINNKEFLLCHDASDPRIKQRLTDDMILIGGHSHKERSSAYFNGKGLSLRYILPSMSRLPEYNGVFSGFKKFDVIVENNVVTSIYDKTYIFGEGNKLIEGPEQHHSLVLGNNYSRKRR